ncbi:MAG: hypothetical protein PVH45_03480, partial [Candidatus Omnitrophota bacterium]
KNMRHYPVQILGGIAIHKGKIAEMVTGEGKTLVATLPATLNALLGEGVHVVTVNDYLARRDAELMRPVYEFLGLSVDYIQNDADAEDREEAIGRRKKAYERDIVYGTNSQFGFDYLKDNMVAQKDKTLQRGHSYAIVDEIDHVLIDDARTPLIISGQSADSNKIYTDMKPAIEKIIQAQEKLIVRYTTLLKEYLKSGDTEEAKRYLYLVHSADPENPEFQDMVSDKRTKRLLDKAIGFFEGKFRAEERDQLLEQLYFTVDGKTRTASFETRGMDLLYQRYGVDLVLRGTGPDPDEEDEKIPAHLRAGQNAKVRALHQLLTAYVVYHKDVDYFIRDGKVVIVDERRGRAEEGRRFSDGLHEALEAKEGVEIQKASINLASITIQNYFRMYDKLAGMTGTAKGEEREFKNTYSLAVVKVPTNRPLIRKGLPDKAYKTEEEKFNAIVEEIARLNAVGRPVLIGTRSIEKSEFLSELLTKRGIEHEVLNAKFDEEEARIVAQAGRFGAVTVATNMAGRGTDIILGGDPEDPEQRERVIRLGGLHVIGSERHDARRIDDQLSGRAGRQGDPGSHQFFVSREDDLLKHRAIKWPFTARIVRAAQRQVERDHSEVRKKVLEYDDVISRHREVIYKWRRKILMEENLKDVFSDCLREYLTAFLKDWEKEYSAKALSLWAKENLKVDIEPGFLEEKEANVIIARLMSLSKRNYSLAETNPNLGEEKIREQLLATVDYYWQEHMKKIESLKDHIGMRSYAQKDPKLEFRKDAFKLFGEFKMDIYEEIIKRVMVMSLFKRGERKAEKPDEPEPKTPKPGLIGKWQIDPEIKFMPGEEGSDKGVLVLEAWDIARSKKDPIEIRLRAERTSPEIFRDFKRTGHDVIDEALEAIRGKLKDRVFLIEPNGYGIEGIGTKEVLAILKPLQESRIAKFHELAHAYIDEELSEYEENGETGKDIEERSFLLKNIINEIIYASLSGRNALDMYLKEKAQKYRIPEDEETRKHWIDAWLPHYALRLFQKTYWGKEDMGLSAEIAKYGPSKSYPPSFPPDHIKFKDSPYQKLHGHLPIEMEIQEVKRNGPLIKPKRESGEFVLNAGVMALKGYRFLFNRIAEGGPNEKGIRRSRVGLLIHDKDFDKEKGEEEIIEIDKDMLLPEDEGLTSEISGVDPYEQLELEQRIANASSAEEAEHRQTVLVNLERDSEIVALEDPRVVERTIKIEKDDGTVEEKSYVYVFLTAVRRDGKYFSAVTMHDADKFFENAMKNHDKEKKEKIEWDWKPLKRLITDKKFRDSNIKNFVPFGNPANGEWYALFRPDQDHNSQIWLAKTDHTNGLAGPWEVVGPYHSTACPPFQWMGASAYVANIPDPEEFYGLAGFDLTLVHAAAGEGDKKYYDIRLFLTDRKDPTKKYISEPILKPEKGAPYEIENGHDLWVPGVIYSCGAILDRSKPNYKRGGYDLTIDIYYSGSDTAVLWATVKVFVKKREDEATKQALAE